MKKETGNRKKREMEIYIHIPFCLRKCNYCDFLSFPSGKEVQDAYTLSLCHEIRQTEEYLFQGRERSEAGPREDLPVRSIFFGGGTPSLLSIYNMERIIRQLNSSFPAAKGAEISLEANPGTLTEEKLSAFRELGINRLSIGLQSTEDRCLKMLGRIHTFSEFLHNYRQARDLGFDNINLDIMSGLPDQSLSSYLETLRIVTELKPDHISSYSLILEEGTPFYRDEKLKARLPDEDTEREMYEKTGEILADSGYDRYEISNYAREGKECIHNLGYWEGVPYLGMGLGASSFWREEGKAMRFSNTTDLSSYLETPFKDFPVREDFCQLTRKEQMEEFMFLGMRKTRGVDGKEFEKRFGFRMEEIFGEVMDRYISMDLLAREESRLFLTRRGINVSNRIFSDFLLD